MKVLVTGGTGSLGIYIIKYLRKAGYDDIYMLSRQNSIPDLLADEKDYLTLVEGDILEKYPLFDILEDINLVIHAAAEVSFDQKDKERMTRINIEGTTNVVNYCLEKKVAKLIHVSSVAAIGRDEKGGMITEETEWSESKYNSTYSYTKYHAEQEVWRGYAEGLAVAIVNPSIILGAGDWEKSSFKLFHQVSKGIPYYPKGSTGLVDVRDVADMIVRLAQSDIEGERYLIVGENMSYKGFFYKMSLAMGVKPPTKPLNLNIGKAFCFLEKIRSTITGKKPIITKESLMSAAHDTSYDASKSLGIKGFSYHDISNTITECSDIFKSGNSQLLKID